MRTFNVELELVVRADGEVPANLEEQLDLVLDELEKLDVVTDADYGASLTRGTVTFTGFVNAADLVDAHGRFTTAVRTAIHAAGGSTASWPTFTDRSVGAHVQEEPAGGPHLVDA